jgi:hypothetical protein
MSDLPTPKYKIGDTVYACDLKRVKRQLPCPDCLGSTEWAVKSPAGTEMTVSCPRCTARYWSGTPNDMPSLDYWEHEATTRPLTIGSVRAETHDHDGGPKVTYMCRETGIGSGSLWYEDRLYETQAEALEVGQAEAALENSENEKKPERINARKISDMTLISAAIKDADSRVWNAWYSYRRLKEDFEEWGAEAKLSGDDREAFDHILQREREHRDSPEPALLNAVKLLLGEHDAFTWPAACKVAEAAIAQAEARAQ